MEDQEEGTEMANQIRDEIKNVPQEHLTFTQASLPILQSSIGVPMETIVDSGFENVTGWGACCGQEGVHLRIVAADIDKAARRVSGVWRRVCTGRHVNDT